MFRDCLRIRPVRDRWNSLELNVYRDERDGEKITSHTLTPKDNIDPLSDMVWHSGGMFERDPPGLVFEFSQGQVLMDDLWNAGIRPTEGKHSSAVVEKMSDHLLDLRKLLFKERGVE